MHRTLVLALALAAGALVRCSRKPTTEIATPVADASTQSDVFSPSPSAPDAQPDTTSAAGAVESLTVGINGEREGGSARACRGYRLAYSKPEAHSHATVVRNNDVWWTIGEHEDNALSVELDRPVRFDHVAVDWYALLGPRNAECGSVIELEVNGAVVARASPPSECRTHRAALNFHGTTLVSLSALVETRALRWVDRSPRSARRRPGTEGRFILAERFTLTTGPLLQEPTVVSVSSPEIGTTSGSAPGGWRWNVTEAGLFAVNPSGRKRRLGAAIGRAEGERVVVRAGDRGRYYVLAPASMGNDGPLTRDVFSVDPMVVSEPSLVASAPGPINDGWWDACRSELVLELESGASARMAADGSLTTSRDAAQR